MKRDIPAAVLRELNRQESGECYLVFLTIYQAQLASPIRVVSDPRNFLLDNKTYIGFMFDIQLLSDSEGESFAQLSIQNVDKRIGDGVLRARIPPRITIEVIAGSEFDLDSNPCQEIGGPGNATRIYKAPYLFLTEVECDALQLSARIVSFDYTQELWPGLIATRDRFPGLFR